MKPWLLKSFIKRSSHRKAALGAVKCASLLLFPRFVVVAVFISLICLGNAQAANRDFTELSAFKTDGCSASPNGLPSTSWAHCCVAHDIWYWLGGSKETRTQADQSLKICMSEALKTNKLQMKWIPGLYAWAVKRGGTPGVVGVSNPFPWRWGFGWSTNHDYSPLLIQSGDNFTAKMNSVVESIPDIGTQLNLNSEQIEYIQEKAMEVYFYHFANSFESKSARP